MPRLQHVRTRLRAAPAAILAFCVAAVLAIGRICLALFHALTFDCFRPIPSVFFMDTSLRGVVALTKYQMTRGSMRMKVFPLYSLLAVLIYLVLRRLR